MSVRENAKSGALLQYFSKVRSSQLFWILSFSVLTFGAAQAAIPVEPVPFTLQTMIVLLAGAFLGSRNGALSQIVYILAGAIGLPVFAEFKFGFATLIGPTGGYLFAFPVAAYIVGLIIENKKNVLTVSLSMLLGSLIILFTGALYLSVFFNGDLSKALFTGVIIFSVWDLIKIGAAVSIYLTFSKKFSQLP
jgi:biotin transport system substrate-specific component